MPDKTTFTKNTVELHYYLNDDSHAINAFIHNRAQAEFLFIARDIAQTFGVEIKIEVTPLKEGGIITSFDFYTPAVSDSVSAGIILMILQTFIATPFGMLIGEWLKQQIFNRKSIESLQDQKLKAEIENLNADTALKRQELENNVKIKIHKSRFYKELQKSAKVEKVSILSYDTAGSILIPEQIVHRTDFPRHIVDSSVLPDINVDHAEIEIISPVLKPGNIKWRGIYDGQYISFTMGSTEFRNKTISGEIEFKTGFTIDCQLVIKHEMDENGIEKFTQYTVNSVNSYYTNSDVITELHEGQKQRKKDKKKLLDSLQMSLFKDEELQ